MHIRAVRLLVPQPRVDELIERASDGIAEPRGAAGMIGYAVHVRRDTGELLETTVWESAGALAASERMAVEARGRALQERADLRVVDVGRSELLWQDRRSRQEAPAFARLDIGSLASGRLDDFAAFVREALAPGLADLRGYRSILVAGDRTTEIVAVLTEWTTAEDRTAADPAFLPVLRRGADFALRPIEIQLWERVC